MLLFAAVLMLQKLRRRSKRPSGASGREKEKKKNQEVPGYTTDALEGSMLERYHEEAPGVVSQRKF